MLPETRKDFLRLTKKAKPELPIPELEIEDATTNAVSKAYEIEKVMLEKNIPNHETAAEYWKWMQQSAAPTPGTSYNPSTLSKFDLSKYQKNPVAAARDEAFKALNELRKSPKPIGL